jgi:hypothetical protein
MSPSFILPFRESEAIPSERAKKNPSMDKRTDVSGMYNIQGIASTRYAPGAAAADIRLMRRRIPLRFSSSSVLRVG